MINMKKPYVLVSDIHFHNWASFAETLPDGTNSRLRILINEMHRACDELLAAGGDTMRIAGDVFHVRGSIAPSVLNLVIDFVVEAEKKGVKIEIIAGNHDLEGKHSENVGNAVRTLTNYPNVTVIELPRVDVSEGVVMVPWVDNLDDLRNTLQSLAEEITSGSGNPAEFDVIIHAPLNGVIVGLPDKGLTTEELVALGFKRIFAGHYHNHKELAPNFAVTSIGALAHHSWSDVNTKAGFLLVQGDSVKWFKSHAPEFVDIADGTTEEEMMFLADGNYVRAHVTDSKVSTIEQVRETVKSWGAKGVVIRHVKAASVTREGAVGASIKSGASVHESVSEFVNARHAEWAKEKVDTLNQYCQQILAEASV